MGAPPTNKRDARSCNFNALGISCKYENGLHNTPLQRWVAPAVQRGLINPGKRQISVPGGGSTLTHHQPISSQTTFIYPSNRLPSLSKLSRTLASATIPCEKTLLPPPLPPTGASNSRSSELISPSRPADCARTTAF